MERLNAEVGKALKSKELQDKLAADGSEPMGGSPQRFAEHIRAEHAKGGGVIREAGIRLE